MHHEAEVGLRENAVARLKKVAVKFAQFKKSLYLCIVDRLE